MAPILIFMCAVFLIKEKQAKELTPEEKAIKVRLVGEQNHTGKVEIQYQGTWGVVCDYYWYTQDAHVICRMLGYKGAERAIRFIEGETTRRMLVSVVRCSGTEKSIAECYHRGWWNNPLKCSNKHLAGVVCQTNEDPPPVQVRLAGGRSANSGRLEVRYHGQWGTVCRRGWDMKGAEVVCRMLGYPGVQEYITTNFTPVKGIIWLRFVVCTGRERSIADCRHSGWGMAYCFHREDVGVTCKMAPTTVKLTTQMPTTTAQPSLPTTTTTTTKRHSRISSARYYTKATTSTKQKENEEDNCTSTTQTNCTLDIDGHKNLKFDGSMLSCRNNEQSVGTVTLFNPIRVRCRTYLSNLSESRKPDGVADVGGLECLAKPQRRWTRNASIKILSRF